MKFGTAALLVVLLVLTLTARPTSAQLAGGLNLTLRAAPPSVLVGQNVTFDLSAAPPAVLGGALTSVVLAYGDGQTFTVPGPFTQGQQLKLTTSHPYSVPGTFTATLSASASNGASNTATQVIAVTGVVQPPAASPTGTPTPGAAGVTLLPPLSAGTATPRPSTTATYQPGWNIIAVPSGATIPGSLAAVYAYPAGATGYQPVENMYPGTGYWAYFTGPSAAAIPLGGPQTTTTMLFAGYWVLIGNPGSTNATVTGADAIYTYTAADGYQSTTTLSPGQGAWAFSMTDKPATIASR